MIRLIDLDLQNEVGGGGEGKIYRLNSHRNKVAKVYLQPKPPDFADKLSWMIDHKPSVVVSPPTDCQVTWPEEVVWDSNNNVIGFIMAEVKQATIVFNVYNPAQRKKYLPEFDLRYCHRAALNIARIIESIHTEGCYVLGDINESNALVTNVAGIHWVDPDSFQVTASISGKKVIFRCGVGKPEFTPPELHKKAFRDAARFETHDRFGTAVLLFLLLMEGNHPFRSHWLGAGNPPSLPKSISEGYFPYENPTVSHLVAPPCNAPSIDTLHPDLHHAFIKTFVDGHTNPEQRTTVKEFKNLLENTEQDIVACNACGGYHYATAVGCQTRKRQRTSKKPKGATKTASNGRRQTKTRQSSGRTTKAKPQQGTPPPRPHPLTSYSPNRQSHHASNRDWVKWAFDIIFGDSWLSWVLIAVITIAAIAMIAYFIILIL